MIRELSERILLPYKTYRDNPEKNVDFEEYIDKKSNRRYMYFQAQDFNRQIGKSNQSMGFVSLTIYTDRDLKVGDTIMIKKIIGIKVFYRKTAIICEIFEDWEKPVKDDTEVSGFEEEETDF